MDVALANGDVPMSWKPAAPAGPATDDKGRAVLLRCVTKTFGYGTGWLVAVDQTCQGLGYADYTSVGTTPPPLGAPQNAFDDGSGLITSNRLYNVLERDSG